MSSSREPVAATIQRLAVLLSAGVAPNSAWGYLDDPVAARVAAAEDVGAALAREAPEWRTAAAAWTIATDAGAPLAPTLREFARSLRQLAAVERDIETALAGPRATVKLVMLLPVVAVLFGTVLGFDSIRVLFATPPGLACLGGGVVLMAIAFVWNRRLLAAARPTGDASGLRCELVAVAVSGGGSLDRATAAVDAVMRGLGLSDPSDAALESVIALSVRAGVPAAELLRSEAEESRRRAAASAERKAAVLAVRLMLPLGCASSPPSCSSVSRRSSSPSSPRPSPGFDFPARGARAGGAGRARDIRSPFHQMQEGRHFRRDGIACLRGRRAAAPAFGENARGEGLVVHRRRRATDVAGATRTR